jgi:steroid delta-isomerase-like uncharacterized protein
LSVLAYNLGNLWQRLGLPQRIKSWSLTSLQRRLVKTGGRLVKLLAEGTRWCCARLGTGSARARGIQALFKAYRDAFPDIQVTIESIVSEGDLAAVRWTAVGTHTGKGLGFPATGKRVELTGMAFLRAENGRLIEGWNNFDQLGMLQQVGVVSLPA